MTTYHQRQNPQVEAKSPSINNRHVPSPSMSTNPPPPQFTNRTILKAMTFQYSWLDGHSIWSGSHYDDGSSALRLRLNPGIKF